MGGPAAVGAGGGEALSMTTGPRLFAELVISGLVISGRTATTAALLLLLLSLFLTTSGARAGEPLGPEVRALSESAVLMPVLTMLRKMSFVPREDWFNSGVMGGAVELSATI